MGREEGRARPRSTTADESGSRGVIGLTLRAATRFDRGSVTPVAGAVTALPVVGLFALGLAAGTPRTTAGLALGAMFVGLASTINGPRLAGGAMALDACGLAVSALVGGVCAGVLWLHVATLVLWCFVGGLMVALGPTRSVVGTQGVMAMIVFGRAPESVGAAVTTAVAVLVGGAVQTAVQLAVRLPSGTGEQRLALATVFTRLAAMARGPAGALSPTVAGAIDAASTVLGTRTLFGRADVQRMLAALDEARRLRLELLGLDGLVDSIREARASHLASGLREAIATSLDTLAGVTAVAPGSRATIAHDPGGGTEHIEALGEELGEAPVVGALAPSIAARTSAIAGQLRASGRLLTDDEPTGPRLRRRGLTERAVEGVAVASATLADHLTFDSAAFRHALRLAVVVPVLDVAFQQSGLARSYWIALSAAVVLRPDFASTMTRGVARVVGSAFGVGAVGVLVAVAPPGSGVELLLAGVTAWGTFAFYQSSYAVGVAFLTGLVLVLIGGGQQVSLSVAGIRIVDTVIGGSVALVAYLVWPTWSRGEARFALTRLIGAQRRYLRTVLGWLATGRAPNPDAVRAAARQARLAYLDAQAAVGRSLAEPASRRIEPDLAQGVLVALRRLVRAAHRLRVELPASGPTVGARQFAERLDTLLARAASDLSAPDHEADRSRIVGAGLRETCLRIERSSTVAPAVLAQLDEMVNAVDTVAVLTGPGPATRV